MHARLHEFLSQDHQRIDAFLRAAEAGGRIDLESFEAFRGRLLRHIGMEEKILLPAARRASGGEPLAIARQLKADHAALAALVVPTPTVRIIDQIRALLSAHNVLEEEPGGLYDVCDQLAGSDAERLLERLRAAPAVPLAPHYDGQRAFDGIERLLRAAGRQKT
jgi:hypothetical protein